MSELPLTLHVLRAKWSEHVWAGQGCQEAFRKTRCGGMDEQRLMPAAPCSLLQHHCTDGQHGLAVLFSLHGHH